MKYAVWFVRLIYAAWMIPAGLNHFIRLYPQPIGNMPLSMETFTALLDSGLFTFVKATELAAGIVVLIGWRLPLFLIMVLPVSFTVWYWDTELQGWYTGSAVYGWSVLLCNLFLLYAYVDQYKAMFARNAVGSLPWRATPTAPTGLDRPARSLAVDTLRQAMGLILLVTALAWFFPGTLSFIPGHQFTDPMAARLMAAFQHSGLLAVAEFIHFAAGLMLLGNRAAPFALAATLPVNICGTFIAVLMEGDPVLAVLALALTALNALLMLAYLPYYAGVLDKSYLADGEDARPGGTYESVFNNPASGAPVEAYLGGGVVLLAALAFYWFVVPGLNSLTGLLTLAIPAILFAAGLLRALAKKPSPA